MIFISICFRRIYDIPKIDILVDVLVRVASKIWNLICVVPTWLYRFLFQVWANCNSLSIIPVGINCTNVKCPEMVACPADSYRLPAITSENDCCPASQGCQCLPHCETFTCAADLVAAIVVEGSNAPGKCCPVYRCTKPGE